MNLLVLGGTGFVGGAVVAEALRRDWAVAVLNRGLHGTVPDGVRHLRGDRTAEDGLAALDGARWDAVVDTWDGAPRAALASARALAGSVGRYLYVSSRSVYQPPVALGADESAPIVYAAPDAADGEYAQLKAGAERAVAGVFGDRAVLARAGLILGPGEDIGRLPWWLRRVARGGRVLAPGPRDLPLQYIDVRDLAAWLLDQGTAGTSGAYNVVSRIGHTTMGELLGACLTATEAGGSSGAELCWIDPEPILAAGVVPWNDLPIWIPPAHEYRWLHECDTTRAYAAGLRCRPVIETVADTWRWLNEHGEVPARAGRPSRVRVGLDPAREAELLAAG